jgi:hypothetical protein
MSKFNGQKSKARNVFITIIGIGVFLYYFFDINPLYTFKYIRYAGDKVEQKLNQTNYGTDSDGELNSTEVEEAMNQIRSNLPEKNSYNKSQESNTIKSQVVKTDTGTEVHLQEVKNLGYTFYLAEIDSVGATSITDDLKNQITSIIYTAKFPANLLKETPIIILNSLALTGDQYISVSNGNLNIPDLKPDFLSEGGLYLSYPNGSSVIVINKSALLKGDFKEVLTHELGHAVGSKLTDQDWAQFYKLRNIPTNQTRRGTTWKTSPTEDFAEVYKNIFTSYDIKTFYGQYVPRFGKTEGYMSECYGAYDNAFNKYQPKPVMDESSSGLLMLNQDVLSYSMGEVSDSVLSQINSDEILQSCRRDIMTNPDKHQSEWGRGVPYKSSVDQATKDFILNIVARLN